MRPSRLLLQAQATGLLDKVLVANRGEIACRVMRTAKRLGVNTVAVYSDQDRNAQHVKMADEAYNVGPAAAAESYLRAEKILEVALESGAKGVHPGYGFLSENGDFSNALQENGVTFIGPPAQAMYDMGSKSASKRIMIDAGVPVTPGYHGEDQSEERFLKEAREIGYPVILKAVMGGGGKGMRIVYDEKDLPEALEGCRREAIKSFNDDKVLVERYLTNPRHIEFQVFADTHGNCVHLFERDCSVQRRHQKVLEEAPAPFMTEEQRAKMGKAAVDAALAVGYVGAGTVEFMLDTDDRFYFMEMNTRLQVEHPVTEAVTGVDLVEWQLKIASGHPLPMTQADLKPDGHAVEARIYAEDPDNDFLPAAGHVKHLRQPPESGEQGIVRVDTGVVEGDEVSIYYDPMISKLITKGEDRAAALRLMARALEQYRIVGLPNNIGFLRRAVQHPAFLAGGVDTNFIDEHGHTLLPEAPNAAPKHAVAAAVLATLRAERQAAAAKAAETKEPEGPWVAHRQGYAAGRITGGGARRVMEFRDPALAGAEETSLKVAVETNRDGSLCLSIGGSGDSKIAVDGDVAEDGDFKMVVDGVKLAGSVVGAGDDAGGDMHIFVQGLGDDVDTEHMYKLEAVTAEGGDGAGGASATSVQAPMPGKIVKLNVGVGDTVEANQAVVVVEAMKMEHIIRVPCAATIDAVYGGEGDFVDGDAVLVEFTPAE